MSRSLGDYYVSTLRESRGQVPPNIDHIPSGILVALIKERPTIWNSSAKLTRDDVLASFQQCSTVLSNMDPSFNIWAIIEKWCWIVESYVRCTLTTPPSEWRFNNTLDYLKPFASTDYPYLGCLSKKRRDELTKLYADPEIIKVAEATDGTEFSPGIFRDEMYILSGDEHLIQCDIDSLTRTIGQIMNHKRRGRPSKADKRSPIEQFAHLTPQTLQLQKLIENGAMTFNGVSFVETDNSADDFGFTPAMYNALIEIIQDKPAVWQPGHSQKGNIQIRDQIFEDVAAGLILKFKDTVDQNQLQKLTGSYVRKAWERLKERFNREENSESLSKWRYFLPLQFLSTRLMPAFLLENVLIKSEDPSTSSGITTRLAVASPSGSSQSEDSRMAASSPATTQFAAVSNGNKSIKTVLDNLVARSKKDEFTTNGSMVLQPQEFSELKSILEGKMPKLEMENGPPMKRMKQEEEGSPTGTPRMIVYNNDARQTNQAPISTWVPPREDLTAKGKEDTVAAAPQKRAQATAVIKSGFPLEKHLKRMLQQNPCLIPATAAGTNPQRNNLITLNNMTIPHSALQQALLNKKIEPASTIASMAIPSVSAPQLQQTHTLVNGVLNGNTAVSTSSNIKEDPIIDRWSHIGNFVVDTARKLEAEDPMAAYEFLKDIIESQARHSAELRRRNGSPQ